jgi:hypothetical protein
MFIYPTLTTDHINLPIRSGQSIIVKSYGAEETTVQLQGDSYQVPLPFIQLATLFNNTQTFGPFETDRTIRIQNRNATVEYDVGFQPALASSTSSLSLTDAQLRAAPLNTNAPATVSKIEELRLQLVTLLGNTDNVETLQQNSINLLTLTNQSVDGLEALITTLGNNTDGLEGLLSTITGHVDALEPLLTDLKTLATADATKQDTHTTVLNNLIGHVDTLEALTTDLKTLATADATKQDAHTTALNAINGKMPTLGQKAMTASQPVVLASDQSAIPVTSPTLLAKEEEIRVLVAALNTKAPTLGQKTMVASQPVTLASDQPAIQVAYAAVTRTPTLQNATAAGTVAAGAVQVSILNTGTTAATVAGGQLQPGASITWSPPKGETLPAINYTATATSPLTISRLG